MAQFTFGPVEFYLVGLDGDRPSPAVISALTELIDAGLVRLLDFVLISKSVDGDVTVTEVEEQAAEFGLGDVDLDAIGITGDEDIEEFAAHLEPSTTAALVALEMAWAKRLAEKVAASGAEVLAVERIPAPVVNGLVDALVEDDA